MFGVSFRHFLYPVKCIVSSTFSFIHCVHPNLFPRLGCSHGSWVKPPKRLHAIWSLYLGYRPHLISALLLKIFISFQALHVSVYHARSEWSSYCLPTWPQRRNPPFQRKKTSFMNRNTFPSQCNTGLPDYRDTYQIDRKLCSSLNGFTLENEIYPRPINATITVIGEACDKLEIHVSTFS